MCAPDTTKSKVSVYARSEQALMDVSQSRHHQLPGKDFALCSHLR